MTKTEISPKEVAKRLSDLVKKHGGWIDEYDDEIIRFPSPHAKAQFEKEWMAH